MSTISYLFVEVHVEKIEDKAKHGGAEAITETSDPRDHPLDQTLQHNHNNLRQ
jgi:hypothetical protein